MSEKILREFTDLIALAPRLLRIAEKEATKTPQPDQWCKKEILGHLIDSAANNHHRFVRLQMSQELAFPAYAQNEWVAIQRYQGCGWSDLVEFWVSYNRHLRHIVANLDSRTLSHVWKREDGSVSLEFLITDYLSHMRHHLEQILDETRSAPAG